MLHQWHQCSIPQIPSRARHPAGWRSRGLLGGSWGSPPCGVPFICCFADVGFGSCLTHINYSTTAPSLWQNQLWSSCPESGWCLGWSCGHGRTLCGAALTVSTSVHMWRRFPWQGRSKYGTSTCSCMFYVYPGTCEKEGAAGSAPISKASSEAVVREV